MQRTRRACFVVGILVSLLLVAGCDVKRPGADIGIKVEPGGKVVQSVAIHGLDLPKEAQDTLAKAGWTTKPGSSGVVVSRAFNDLSQYQASSEALTTCICQAFAQDSGYAPKVEQGQQLRIASTNYLIAKQYKVTYRPPVLDFTPTECVTCSGSGTVTCDTCGGKGSADCATCGGDGEVECDYCQGKGWTECSSCSGTGESDCSYCGGTGRVTDWWSGATSTCTACNGKGKVKCSWCEGKGKIKCNSCEGSGKLTCGDCGGAGTITCPTCDGRGTVECSVCSGTGDPPQELLDKAGTLSKASVVRVSFDLPGVFAKSEGSKRPPEWRLEGEDVSGGDDLVASSWTIAWGWAAAVIGVLLLAIAAAAFAIVRAIRRRRGTAQASGTQGAAQGAVATTQVFPAASVTEVLPTQPEASGTSIPPVASHDESATRFCPQCGAQNSSAAAFCKQCGKQMRSAV